MKIGEFTIEQLSEGFFELFEDGTFQKIESSRLDNLKDDPNIGKFTSAIGIDPLLIQKSGKNILVDPGLGWGLDSGSQYKKASNVVTNLDIFDLSPRDIHYVILTHLHFDHAAGISRVSEDLKTEPTFPNAEYILHQDEWDYALSQINRDIKIPGAGYKLDEMYKLIAEERFTFVDQEIYEPVDGVFAIKTGGHTPGHMIVKLKDGDNSAYFMGDLVPTEYHLNHYSMRNIDIDPLQSKKSKTLLLKQALKEKAVMFFYHSLFKKSGKLSRDPQKKYILLKP
ncbi:MBL fold metallo-hydrolase [Rhodohalobacter sulfatireducens]|uniref:MBL fold metallo-hydrolase n=1 Tax=Rhodohalobacter sulfatireducens TaxID=2911366 RepID=A0ABS9KCY3_9BACT|nr:MBL fold metallo-hydrolase [Rhodohalobacter sulfatireducens]MCG2588693.1 MBL fold metallo-hydrolase [Rhodohalobacter sulfatireducens]MDR9364138.1 MBL fold metallo-hydrolase [Balneolaceae bacterium]MDR9407721.1 MBL fold metallo-hydrolase [Balneolaceae bacterium]